MKVWIETICNLLIILIQIKLYFVDVNEKPVSLILSKMR